MKQLLHVCRSASRSEPERSCRTVTRRCRGLTLLELVVVLVVLVALAGIVVPMVSTTSSDAQLTTTKVTLQRLQDVIMNRYWPDMDRVLSDDVMNPIRGFPHPGSADITGGRANHPQLCFLFFPPTDPAATWNPTTRRGWNGPYLQSNTGIYRVDAATGFTDLFGTGDGSGGIADDPAVADAWGNPIVIQVPIITDNGVLDEDELRFARLISAGPNGAIDTPASALAPTLAEREDDIVQFLRVADTEN